MLFSIFDWSKRWNLGFWRSVHLLIVSIWLGQTPLVGPNPQVWAKKFYHLPNFDSLYVTLAYCGWSSFQCNCRLNIPVRGLRSLNSSVKVAQCAVCSQCALSAGGIHNQSLPPNPLPPLAISIITLHSHHLVALSPVLKNILQQTMYRVGALWAFSEKLTPAPKSSQFSSVDWYLHLAIG